MNDLIRLAMELACRRFGSDDTFNGANFSHEFMRLAGLQGQIDGRIVRCILAGRPDVEVLHGFSHYRLITK